MKAGFRLALIALLSGVLFPVSQADSEEASVKATAGIDVAPVYSGAVDSPLVAKGLTGEVFLSTSYQF